MKNAKILRAICQCKLSADGPGQSAHLQMMRPSRDGGALYGYINLSAFVPYMKNAEILRAI